MLTKVRGFKCGKCSHVWVSAKYRQEDDLPVFCVGHNGWTHGNVSVVKLDGFKCNICGHSWTSKKYDKRNPPLYCGKCKSAAWDRTK